MQTNLTGKRVLRLTLKKQWFDILKTSKERVDCRKPTPELLGVLLEPNGAWRGYDYVLFASDGEVGKEWFLVKYLGWCQAHESRPRTYGEHTVYQEVGDVMLPLGPVIESGNLPA